MKQYWQTIRASRGGILPLYAAFILAGMLAGWGSDARAVPPGEVYAHYTFDAEDFDGVVVRDSGPHGFHGRVESLNETPPAPVAGIRGEAIGFPQGHESWIELDPGFSLTPPFTITVWARVEARRTTMEIIGRKAHSWDQGMRFVFSLRRMLFEYGDGDASHVVRNDLHQTAAGQWVFLAVVHDGEEVALYVDAEEMAREPAFPVKTPNQSALVGNYIIRKDMYGFVGKLDEMILFSEALPPEMLLEVGLRTLGW